MNIIYKFCTQRTKDWIVRLITDFWNGIEQMIHKFRTRWTKASVLLLLSQFVSPV